MVSTARELLENLEKYRCLGMKYWYGGKGQRASVNLAKRLKRENPNVWTQMYYDEAMEDVRVGATVCDCSGLVCLVYDMPQIGSYQIAEKLKEWKEKPKVGMIAWRPGHVGIISTSTGIMAEMRSIKYDYKETRKWQIAGMQKILYSPDIDYDNVQSVGWHQDSEGWWYATGVKNGQYYKDCIATINGVDYVFNSDGYLHEGVFCFAEEHGTKIGISTHDGVLVTDENGFVTQGTLRTRDFITVSERV